MTFPFHARRPLDAETDVLVVGGGVVGCSTAYYLARDGVDVILIERGDLNTQASGRNAGSLHVQIQGAFYKSDSEEILAGRLDTLPLFMEGVRIWKGLAQELDDDIELVVNGGLMVAETEDQMRFLAMKAERERSRGIEVEIIGADEVGRLAPYLSARIIGAEFCPHEGKLNPIRAVPAIARGAEKAGARLLREVELLGLERDNGVFRARTSRGTIRCRRVVNAAGPFAPAIGAMVGIDLPIEQRCVQGTITEPVEPFVSHLVYHVDRILTFKQVKNGNLLIGGGWPAHFDAKTGHMNVLRDSVQSNMWVAQLIVPRVGHLRLIRAWAGVNLRTDGRPILGEVRKVPGFYLAITADAGLSLGPACARLLAETLKGRNASYDIGAFSIDRFDGVPSGRPR